MQATSKDICKNVSEETGLDYEMLLTINDQLFRGLSKKSKEGKHLGFEIPGLGTFLVRGKKTYPFKERIEKWNYSLDYVKFINRIIELYAEYRKWRYDTKVKKYGKETHEAFLLGKKQKEISEKA